MSDNKKRIIIRCWNAPDCGRTFSLLRQFDGHPVFLIPCPFCGQTNVIDLNLYRSRIIGKYAGDDDPLTLDVLELPDVLPGRAPLPGEEEGD